jgi:hypothetical protein
MFLGDSQATDSLAQATLKRSYDEKSSSLKSQYAENIR